jgi:hypothetical protein
MTEAGTRAEVWYASIRKTPARPSDSCLTRNTTVKVVQHYHSVLAYCRRRAYAELPIVWPYCVGPFLII